MIFRGALIFIGLILAGVFLNLYFIVYAFFGIFLLGIESKEAFNTAYFICLILGSLTAFFLIRIVWPKPTSPSLKSHPAPESSKSPPA